MQTQLIDQHCINSFIYTNQQKDDSYISPQVYQKKRDDKKKVTKPSKKIILGKPCNGKHKMNLDELKALSRQIKPYRHHVDCTTTDINSLVKKLKSNMNKAKSRMLQQLKLSNSPIYQSILCEQQQQQEEEDDSSSVSTSCTYQDLYQSLLSLYPTTSCLNNMTTTTTTQNLVSEVTEDQINTWLQRGGFSSSPLTMATDQELADLLHFDEL